MPENSKKNPSHANKHGWGGRKIYEDSKSGGTWFAFTEDPAGLLESILRYPLERVTALLPLYAPVILLDVYLIPPPLN